MMSPPCRLSLFYDLGVGKKECLPPPKERFVKLGLSGSRCLKESRC